MTDQNLKRLRQRIDEANLQILKILNERTEIVKLVGIEKEKQRMKFYDPIREKQIIDQLREKNQGPMTDEMVSQVFKEIFKMSVDFQKKK